MRFFKYLVFIILSFISINSFAATTYSLDNASSYPKILSLTSSSKDSLCSQAYSIYLDNYKNRFETYAGYTITGNYCNFMQASGGVSINFPFKTIVEETKCWYPDYKIVTQPITSLKKVMCLPVNGVICKYTGDPTGSPIINGSITTSFSSVSQTPDPSCKEQLVNPPCDPKDPYGGCFTPPDDGCTRQFNGSIECPADTVPPVEKGCNGATYCDRPPQGCGEGYVSGSYNGKQICIKTSPSTGSGDGSGTGGDGGDASGTGGDGSGTGSTTGTGTGTSTSTNTTTNSDGSTTTTTNTTVNNFSIDFSPVTNAIKKLSDQLTNFKNELLTSVTDLGKKIDSTNTKIDSTNTKLDSTNTKLTEINDSALRQEELLKAIRDKESSNTGGDGSPSDQPASGASTDLTETNGILNEIKDWLTEEVKDDGQSVETPFKNLEQKDINSSLYKITGQCPAPKTFYTPVVGHTFQLDLTKYCNVLSIIGILVSIAACLHGVAILSENT